MLLGSFVEIFDRIPDAASTTTIADTARPVSQNSDRLSSQKIGETSAAFTQSLTGQPTRISPPAIDIFTARRPTYGQVFPEQSQRTSPPAIDGFIPGAPGRSRTSRTEYISSTNGQREGQQHNPPANSHRDPRLPRLPARYRSVG